MRKSLLLFIALLAGFIAACPTRSAAKGQDVVAQGRVECNTIPSRIMAGAVRYCALLPPGYDARRTRPYPVLYFLHGLGDNEQSLVNTGAWNIAERLRESGSIGDLLIITPDGDRSFYINSHDGRRRYEDFFIREFIPGMERRYRVATSRSGRAIGGVSMGGYGALRFAFKYPQMFTSVAVHMAALYAKLPPAFSIVAASDPRAARLDSSGVFGSPPDEAFWERNSPLTLAATNTAALRRLRIYFDCGDADGYGFDAGARDLDRILTAARVPHEMHIYPGGHDWTFVAAHFGESLQFQWNALAPPAKPH